MARYKCWCGAGAESEEGCWKHKPRKALKKGGRLKAKPKTEEQKEESQEDWDRMWAFFTSIWNKLPKVKRCWNCGIRIFGSMRSLYFDHLLEKSKYDHLKYEEENIFFCCWECHTNKGNGNPGEKHKAAIEAAKIRFGIS